MKVKYVIVRDQLRREGDNIHWEARFPDYPEVGGFGGTEVLPMTPAEFKTAIEAKLIVFIQDYQATLALRSALDTQLNKTFQVDVP